MKLGKGAGKLGLEEGHRKVWLGGRASESEAWIKGTGKQGLDEGCRKARLG